jgi:hypothetical protein
MSRSYRRPYSAPCGNASAHQDKMLASRGVRRAQNRAVREAQDWEEFELPHRFECNHNDVWGWGRDGKQTLQRPPVLQPWWNFAFMTAEEWYQDDLKRYQRLMRK